jgi:hypothetical protein
LLWVWQPDHDGLSSFCEGVGINLDSIDLEGPSLKQLVKQLSEGLEENNETKACITCLKTSSEPELRAHLHATEAHIYPLWLLKAEKKMVLALIAASKDADASQKENVVKAKFIFAVKKALLIRL